MRARISLPIPLSEGTTGSSRSTFRLGWPGIALLCLGVLSSTSGAQSTDGPALAAGGRMIAGLHGVVLDTADRPIAGVQVLAQRTALKTRLDVTRDEGRFAIAPLAPGEYLLSVRAIGYRPADFVVTVAPDPATQPRYELVLEPAPLELRSMLIVASPLSIRRLTGFARRQQFGTGHYLTSEDIMRSQATRLSDMLLTLPGLAFVPWAANGNYRSAFSRSGGPNGVRCMMGVYLDGTRLPDGWSVDDLTTLENVAAVEVYSRWMSTPQRFVGGGYDDRCGAIAVWTKDGAGIS